MVDKIDILIKEIEERINQLESDRLIDSNKKSILIRENKRFLVRCQQLFLSSAINSFCKCKGGAKGRTMTQDFEHQICEECGKLVKN